MLNLVLIAGGACTVLLAWRSLAAREAAHGELHALLLSSIAGMSLLAAAQNTVILFLGPRAAVDPAVCAVRDRNAPRALAGVGAEVPDRRLGRLGHAAVRARADLRRHRLDRLHRRSRARSSNSILATDPLTLTGIALCVAGLCFKASVAPFHQWTPDVYEGAPTPVTAFMAVATKVAALGVFLRLFDVALIDAQPAGAPAVAALAAITIIVGNVGALGQSSLKRMLAYSSVAQAGYMLAGVVVGEQARRAGDGVLPDRLSVHEHGGLRRDRRPRARNRPRRHASRRSRASAASARWLAWPMTLSMLGLAGIPATAGFVGKFYLIDAAVSGGYTWLGVVIVIGSMISLGYYLPVIAAMWMTRRARRRATDAAPPPAAPARDALPALAGGSPELDVQDAAAARRRAASPR